MSPNQRQKLYQQRDALLATLNYADDEEAQQIKQLINQINERLVEDERLNERKKANEVILTERSNSKTDAA